MVFAIHPHELATGIHVSLPPPSPPYPSGLSQSTGFGCPVSCTGYLFFIWQYTCFTVFSDTVQKSVFTSV